MEISELGLGIKEIGNGRFAATLQMKHMKRARYFIGTSCDEVARRMQVFIHAEEDRKAIQKARLMERNARIKRDRIEAAAKLKVGDIFCNSWGYEQTNVDFFEVIGIQGSMAEIRAISQEEVPGSQANMSESVTPIPGAFHGESFKKIIQSTGTEPYFSMGHGWCGKWDGRPKYQSHYA